MVSACDDGVVSLRYVMIDATSRLALYTELGFCRQKAVSAGHVV